MFKGLFRKKRFVGLDLGASSVKAIELSGKNSNLTLTGLGTEPLPRDAVLDGYIIDDKKTSQVIKILFQEKRLNVERVAAGISGYSTILKNILVPLMTEEELRESLDWHAEEHLPFDISDVRLDYQILGLKEDALEVMLAASKPEKISNLEQTLKLAGQRAEAIDFDALALQNCYTFNYQPADDSLVLLLHIGASEMIINIVRGCHQDLSREIPMGGDDYTSQIQKELGLTFEQAEAVKLGGARDIEIEGAEIGEAVEAISKRLTVETDLGLMIETISDRLQLEIQKTLDFWRATSAEDETNIQKILLSGGGSRLKGLKEFLSSRFEIPVETLDPFRRIKTNSLRFSPEYLSEIAPEMAIAVGLALRWTGEPMLSVNLAGSGTEKKQIPVAAAKKIKERIKKESRKETEKVYLFKGRNRLGEIVIGERAAKSRRELRERLRREQVILTFIGREGPPHFLSPSGWRRKKVSASDLESFTRRFAFLIEWGSPILWSLESLAQEQKNIYFRKALDDISSDVGQGADLSSAMSRHPEVFDESFVNICQAGETGGILDIVLKRLQSDLETSVKLQRSLRLMILYPISLLAGTTLILMLSVMAALHNASAERLGQNGYLRFWARVVTSTGAFLGSVGGMIVLSAVIVALLSLGLYSRTERGRRQKDELLLRVPFLGSFLRKFYIARFARRLSTLLSSGVPIMASLESAAKRIGNQVFEAAIWKVRNGVERGETFPAEMNEMFPALVRQVIGIGEQVGSLDTSLSDIADLYEEDVDRAVSRLPLVLLPIAIALFVLLAVNLLLIAR